MIRSIVILLAMTLVAGCATPAPQSSGDHPAAAPFSLPTISGANASLADNKGKVVVLDFWATWCPPCRASFPHLQALASDADKAKDGLVVIAIDEQETPDQVRSFLDQNHYTLTVARDDGTAAHAYGVSAFPTTFVIGRDGTIRATFEGITDATPRELEDAIAAALKEPAR